MQNSIIFGWNTSLDKMQMKNCRNLILGRVFIYESLSHLRFLTLFIEWLWVLVLIAWLIRINIWLYWVCTKEKRNGRKKEWRSTQSILNLKSSSCKESLGKHLSLFSCNTLSSVYRNESYRGHCASVCNDVKTNSRPIPI